MWSKAFLVALLTAVAVGAADSVSEDRQETKAKKKVMRREVSSMLQSQNENDVLQSQEVTTLAAAAAKLSNEQFSLLQDILDKQVEEREVLSHSKDDVTMTSKGDITHEEELVDANVHADSAGVMEVSGSGGLLDHKTVDSLESDEGSSHGGSLQGSAVEDEGQAIQSGEPDVRRRGSNPSSCTSGGGRRRTTPDCVAATGVTLIKSGHECRTADKNMGTRRRITLTECAQKVQDARNSYVASTGNHGSAFFIFGTGSKGGACWWEHGVFNPKGCAWSYRRRQQHAYQSDKYNFYELPTPRRRRSVTHRRRRSGSSGNGAGRR